MELLETEHKYFMFQKKKSKIYQTSCTPVFDDYQKVVSLESFILNYNVTKKRVQKFVMV